MDAESQRRGVIQARGRKVVIILQAILPYLKEKKKRAVLGIELAELLNASKPGQGRKISPQELGRRNELASAIKEFNQNLRSEDVTVQ